MKILVVTSTLPYSQSDPVPAFVADQAINLKKEYPHLDIFILAPHYKQHSSSLRRHRQYTEYRFNYFLPQSLQILSGRGIMPALKEHKWTIIQLPFLLLFQFWHLLRLTLKLKPDVIYAHWFTPQGLSAALVSVLTRTPYVFTSHSSDVAIWSKVPLLGRLIVRWGVRRAQAITVVSSRTCQKLEKFFKPEEWAEIKHRVKIIPMGTETSARQTLPPAQRRLKEKYRLADKKVILFIGRLVEKKGLIYLLKAFAQIANQQSKAVLVIAGEGQLMSSLRATAQSLNIQDQVIFSGFISGKQKNDYLNLADMLVAPSVITAEGDAEGLPVSLIEGLAAGKICIATRVSGADDILASGRNGFLIKDRSVSALATAMAKVLALPPKEAGIISANARLLAQEFSWPKIAKQHYDFLFRDS